MRSLFGLLASLILAAFAQKWLGRGDVNAGAALYLLAGAIFIWFAAGPRAWPQLPPRRAWKRPGWMMAVAGVILALIATGGGFMREQYGGWALWLWLGGVALFLLGVGQDEASHEKAGGNAAHLRPPAGIMRRRSVFIALLLIVAVAIFARFYALDAYPHGLQSDEANNGLDALKWLQGAGWMPYAETNEGQATLFTWIIALYIHLFGRSVTVMRMVPATAGVLTVLAFYALAREIYDQRIALLTSALLAADRWHITFSRIVYELILTPLLLTLQILFLIKALKTGRRRWWALAGLMLALGLNTYTAYRVIPLFMLLYFAYWLISHRQRWRRDLEGMGIFLVSALLAVAPLAAYVVHHYDIFFTRTKHISVLRDVEAAGSYAPIWSNLRKVLLMFNHQGDMAPLNNLPGAPMLHAAVGVMFVLGMLWAVRWFWRELPALYLLWFGSIASLAVFSVAHEAPNARRPIALIPLIYLLVAVVISALVQAWQKAFGPKRTRPVFAALTALTIFIIAANLNTYFRVQAVDSSVWYAFSPEESAIGEYVAELPQDAAIYLDPQYYGHAAISFIGGDRRIELLDPTRDIPLREPPTQVAIFIIEPKKQYLIPLLQQLYPTGRLEEKQDRYGRSLFLSFTIPASAFAEARGLNVTYWAGDDTSQPPVRQEKAPNIDFDFTLPDDQPLLPPFAASYQGALLVPQTGSYHLELTSEGGDATLFLDEREVLHAQDGVATLSLPLVAGFQALRLDYQAGEHPRILRLAWATPSQSQPQPVPPQAFYSLPGAANGLVGSYYATPDWSGDPVTVQRDLFITANGLLPSPYSVKWEGKIAAPLDGVYTFGLRSDDGSLLYIDDQLVVDNGGQHGAEYQEGAVQLERGWHDIKILYNDFGGSRVLELWWRPPGSTKSLLPGRYLRPSPGESLDNVPLPSLPEPSPWFQQKPQSPGGLQLPDTPQMDISPPNADALNSFAPLSAPVVWTIGNCGQGEGKFWHPAGVVVDDDGMVYVADTGNHRVVVLDEEGNFDFAWGEEGMDEGQFAEIVDIDITPEGDLAVLDAARQVISFWTPDGEWLYEIGDELALYHPRGFGISDEGYLFIADTGGGRVVWSDEDGRILGSFGRDNPQFGAGQPTDAAGNDDGFIFVPDPTTGLFWQIQIDAGVMDAGPGPRSNTVESPHVAIAEDGNIFLTDPENGRVLVFDSDLRPLAQLGEKGQGPGQFSRTLGVSARAEIVVLTDPDLCRITAFAWPE